jgi:lupus La protein
MSDNKEEPTEATTNPTSDESKPSEDGGVEANVVDEEAEIDSRGTRENDAGEAQKKQTKNGARTYENGMLKTTATEQPDRGRNSKYDPSILKTSDNPKEIRGQVSSYKDRYDYPDTNNVRQGRVLL